MTPPSRDAFVRRLRALDPPALARFVADLYAARGRETSVVDDDTTSAVEGETPVVKISRDEREEGQTFAVVSALHPEAPDADAVVVGRTADEATLDDGTPVVGAAALHRMALYAVERDRLPALLRDHFGANAFADGDAGGTAHSSLPIRFGGRRFAVATALVLVAVVAAAAVTGSLAQWGAGGIIGGDRTTDTVSATTGPESSGTPRSSEATASEQPRTPISPPSDARLAGCPSPPPGVHPAAFRPIPVDTASAFGLDGWQLRAAENVSVYPGRTERRTPYVPEARQRVTYEAPTGTTYVLVADRWSSPSFAARLARVRSYPRQVAFAWGPYTFAVTGSASTGELPKTRLRTMATELLAHVRLPGGGTLGEACVRRLVTTRNTTDARESRTVTTRGPRPRTVTTPQ